MYIPSYQIHNVLKVYTRQLSQTLSASGTGPEGEMPRVGKINIPDEGKRQAVIDKVAADIVERISRFGSMEAGAFPGEGEPQPEGGLEFSSPRRESSHFVFNVIDASNEKKATSLSVEDAQFLSQRLEELVREAVGRKMTPGSGGFE